MISVITTCKGRLDHLKRMVRSLKRSDDCEWELIIVDYNCPDKTWEWVTYMQADDERISCVKANVGMKDWNLANARNLGFSQVEHNLMVLFADADTIFEMYTLREIWHHLANDPYCYVTGEPNCSGNMAAWANQIREVGGYDPGFKGWGAEDADMYIRMSALDLKKVKIKNWSYLEHGSHIRAKFQVDSIKDSQKRNIRRLFEKHPIESIVPEYVSERYADMYYSQLKRR